MNDLKNEEIIPKVDVDVDIDVGVCFMHKILYKTLHCVDIDVDIGVKSIGKSEKIKKIIP